MQAALLAIGDELLAGRTQDRHLAFLAPRMAALGLDLVEVRVVGDDATPIQLGIWELQERRAARLVITTGGLGPTHDDRTVAALATLHGVPLVEHAGTWRHITARAAASGRESGAGARRMALVPRGALVLPNDAGSAPGLALERALRTRDGTAWTLALPGVPEELESIWTMHASPFISMLVGTERRIRHHVEIVCRAREADIAPTLAQVQSEHARVRLGSYPRHRDETIRIETSGTDAALVEAAVAALTARLQGLGVAHERSPPSAPNA